jgi:hypothetical protein
MYTYIDNNFMLFTTIIIPLVVNNIKLLSI